MRLILGDQLNPQHSWFATVRPEVVYVLMEMCQETDDVLHHTQKIIAIFAGMRTLARQLREVDQRVHYLSIDDNRLGGWYSYRASKAALNMLLKTAAIEVKRSNPQAVLVSLHPGTVNTGLSKPFKGEQIGRAATDAARDMLGVLAQLTPADTGSFLTYNGARLPW